MKIHCLFTLLVSVLLVSCSKDKASTPSPKELYAADVQNISTQNYFKTTKSHSYFQMAFERVFGGLQGSSVKNYLNERVKVVLNESELDSSDLQSGKPLTYTSWTKPTSANEDEKGAMMAANLSALYAILGKVNGTTTTLVTPSGTFPITSTRSGVIILSKHYAPAFILNGQTHPNHLLSRISTAIHEARHSDCTGGFPQTYVEQAQQATSIDDFLTRLNLSQMQCGHLHVQCPAESQLAGIYACDKSPWDAYGIQAIYLIAAALNTQLNLDDINALETSIGSALYRIPINFESTIMNTSPNMGHED